MHRYEGGSIRDRAQEGRGGRNLLPPRLAAGLSRMSYPYWKFLVSFADDPYLGLV
jgi:hypothetical protein